MIIYRNMIELSGDEDKIRDFKNRVLKKSVSDALPIPNDITDEACLDNWMLSKRGYRGDEIVLSWVSDNCVIIDTPSYPCIPLVCELHKMCSDISFTLLFSSNVVGKNSGFFLINSEEETLTKFDNFSKESYAIAYKLRPHEMVVHQMDEKLNMRRLYDISDFLSIVKDKGVYKDTEGAELRFIK